MDQTHAIRLPSFLYISTTNEESPAMSNVRNRRRTTKIPSGPVNTALPCTMGTQHLSSNRSSSSKDSLQTETLTNPNSASLTLPSESNHPSLSGCPHDWERRYILDLLQIDTDVDWSDLRRRLLENPSVVSPISEPITSRGRGAGEQTPVLMFAQTILGSLCSMNVSGEDIEQWRQATLSALALCPEQVACSQGTVGHTPLRDGVCNPNLPHDVIESMVKAYPESVHIIDVDGLSPLDHVLLDSHLSKRHAFVGLDRIRILLKHAPVLDDSSKSRPLIRFLSSGYSCNMKPCEVAKPGKLLQYCQLLINWDRQIVSAVSKTTACSILHIAIRNYGNLFSFIEELLRFEGVQDLLAHRNRYGDLPLHVACAAGVPTKVLRLILRKSLPACSHEGTLHPLVWTVNEAGYTPVDLEWMRHIESGRDFFSKRSFYQLDARGVRAYGNAYDSLLQDTVQQVISNGRFMNRGGRRFLLERIFLIIRCATCFKNGLDDRFEEDSDDLVLHKACYLAFPGDAFLPRPIIELILWLAPEQSRQRDSFGKTPLHHVVTNNLEEKTINGRVQSEWYLSVSTLLQKFTHAASLNDADGMLPIHLLLGNDAVSTDDRCSVAAFDRISFDLVQAFPQSLEIPHPRTRLLPFQAAALSDLISLEATFKLLRANPGVIRPDNST